MGFWEYTQAVTDGIRRSSPSLDSLKYACRTAYNTVTSATSKIGAAAAIGVEKARNIAADAAHARLVSSSLAPVKDAYLNAWSHTAGAAGEADRLIRVEALRQIAEWLPDGDQRRQMVLVLRKAGICAADIAISESARCVPGGAPLYQVIKEAAAEIAQIQREGTRAPCSKPSEVADHFDGRAGAAAVVSAIESGGPPPPQRLPEASPPDSAWAAGIHRPEDVVGLFLRGGRFEGRDFLDALIVPVPRWRGIHGKRV